MRNRNKTIKLLSLILLLCGFNSNLVKGQSDFKIDSLTKLLETKKNQDRIEVLVGLVNALRNKDLEKAKSYHKEAIDLSTKYNNIKGLGDCYNNSAKFYYFEGNYDDAITDYQKSFLYRQQIKDTLGIGNVLGNMGVTYRKKGDYIHALEYYHKALAIKQKLKNKGDAIGVINNIGGLYYYQRNYEKAKLYYQDALNLATIEKDSNLIAVAYANLSLVYDDQGEQGKALDYALKALKLKETVGSEFDIAVSYNNIGRIYEHQKKYELALEYYKKANNLYTSINDEPSKCNTLYNIGDLNLKQNNLSLAVLYLDSSLTIAKKINLRTQLRDIYFSLAQTHHQLKDEKLAFNYLNLHTSLNDSIYDEQGLEKLSEMEAKYQTEIHEHKIEVLEHEHEIRNLKEIESKKDFRNTIIIAISALAILIALIFILFYRFRIKKKAHDTLIKFNTELVKQKEIIELQKTKIEEKQKEILDSINYAKRIQNTLFASNKTMEKLFTNYFNLFLPKDIVSGDFYWAAETENYNFLAVCDSTGHGVPGAFMSLLSIGFLNEAIKERNILQPNKILNYVRERLINSMSSDGQKDGFDGVLLCFNKSNGTITYSAANNAPNLIKNNEFYELPYNRMPVGKGEKNEDFILYNLNEIATSLNLEISDTLLIIYTDGYADQFGGERGKKFKYKLLNETLTANSKKDMNEQKNLLEKTFFDWKGELEQVDDVCIMGIKL